MPSKPPAAAKAARFPARTNPGLPEWANRVTLGYCARIVAQSDDEIETAW